MEDFFKTGRGIRSPELLQAAPIGRQTKQSLESNQKDWYTLLDLSALSDLNPQTVKRIIKKVRDTHPEWFRVKRNLRGRDTEHFYKDILTEIIDQLKERKTPPEGWIRHRHLAKNLGLNEQTVARLLSKYELSHPEWSGEFYPKKGAKSVFYAPELVEIIQNEALSREQSPIGWFHKKQLADELGVSNSLIEKESEKMRNLHPEWFVKYWSSGRQFVEHLHPDLIKIIKEKISQRPDMAPVGWKTSKAVAEEIGVDAETIRKIAQEYRDQHTEWFGTFLNPSNKNRQEYYAPALILVLKQLIRLRETPPHGWENMTYLIKRTRAGQAAIKTILGRYTVSNPDWFQIYRTQEDTVRLARYFHPDLVSIVINSFDNRAEAPSGWLHQLQVSQKFGISRQSVKEITDKYREAHPDWFKKYASKTGAVREYFSPELVGIVENEDKMRIPVAPDDWKTKNRTGEVLGVDPNTIYSWIKKYRDSNPEWFGLFRARGPGGTAEYLHPELIEKIKTFLHGEKAPKDWLTRSGIISNCKIPVALLDSIVAGYRAQHPEWFRQYLYRTNRLAEHFHPDLVKILFEYYKTHRDSIKDEEEKERKIKEDLILFSKNAAESSNDLPDSEINYKKLIKVFGSSGAVILLYELRPEFKSIPVEHVKRVLAEYLGSYLSIKHTFNLKDVVAASKFLSNPSLRQAIYENVKADCLRFYFEQRKNGSRADAYEVIYKYLVESLDELGTGVPKIVEDLMLEVMDYYTSAIRDFHKPEQFVDKLAEGRDFPDLHQRINMKELKDKKRILIADEMGLGKSASVIMAKEQMGIGCALVVVPGSVIRLGTWQNYLCDDPERKGYFRAGTAPRVLVVESPKQLEGLKKDQYDYIIVSHERLNGRYAALLAELDPDMLIVDEVHKLKDLKGVRSRSLMPLINKLGSEKYLALLSGTPIPNKVRDIAFVLKLIYPDQFGQMQDGDLVKTIIQSSADEILKMLIPRMQMKELEDVVEMPKREQQIVDVQMSKAEADVYEGLLELDELTAKEKMGVLRKFLMNPALLESTPTYEGSKFAMLRSELQECFKTKSKIIVFVNEYTTGILRGPQAVLVREQLGLPDDVAVEHFYGGDENVKQRASIQQRFNNTPERMVVLISGKTSDVGNSFVAAERTLVYSEPWTEADLRQQLARVFRPGLDHDILEKIFVVGGTIEQGIHEYIRHKYKIIEKVLKGIPTTELEQRLLKKDENQHEDAAVGDRIDFEVNPELARTYFSWKQKLDQFFGHTKENGESRIIEFLKQWGADYAQGYQEMGARSYQSNVNRVTGSLIGEMVAAAGQQPAALQILDIASGPEMLRRHIGEALQLRVGSIDINEHHFAHSTSGQARVASWTKIPCKAGSIDYVNCAMAFQDSSYAPSRGMYERVNVLREMNRVLKVGGRAVISMIYTMRIADKEKFAACMEVLGFKVVPEFSGLATQGNDFESQIVTLEKISDCEKTAEQVVESFGSENVSGLKFTQVANIKLKKPRRVMRGFLLDGKAKIIELNESDLRVVREEEFIEGHVKSLCKQFGSVKNIPKNEVLKHGYVRIFVYGTYYLFKRLSTAPGVLVLNESTS